MANGLSVPLIQSGLNSLFSSLISEPNSSRVQDRTPSENAMISEPEDVLDLSRDASREKGLFTGASFPSGPLGKLPSSQLIISQESLSASVDVMMSEGNSGIAMDGGNPNVLASLRELNINIRVSIDVEQSLIEVGRQRGVDSIESMRAASRQLIERFQSQQIQASMNFSFSFSQTNISFSSFEGLGNDLEGLPLDGQLGGFVTLIQSLFGDDEKFNEFINNLQRFLRSMQRGNGSASSSSNLPATPAGQTVQVETRSVNVNVNLSFNATTMRFESAQPEGEAKDPIILDLDGDGIELTSSTQGVTFDLDADGIQEKVSTATGGDGYLVLDKNGNGKIDDGRELFGDQNGAANGFAELAKYDSNSDGRIDPADSIFDQLRVWVDQNLDGVSQPYELLKLLDVGIQSISLDVKDVDEPASGGNRIIQSGTFNRTNGTTGRAVDALLNQLI